MTQAGPCPPQWKRRPVWVAGQAYTREYGATPDNLDLCSRNLTFAPSRFESCRFLFVVSETRPEEFFTILTSSRPQTQDHTLSTTAVMR